MYDVTYKDEGDLAFCARRIAMRAWWMPSKSLLGRSSYVLLRTHRQLSTSSLRTGFILPVDVTGCCTTSPRNPPCFITCMHRSRHSAYRFPQLSVVNPLTDRKSTRLTSSHVAL